VCYSKAPYMDWWQTLCVKGCGGAQLKAPELKALAACEPPLAPETRLLCAGRAIALVEAAGKARGGSRPGSRNPGPGSAVPTAARGEPENPGAAGAAAGGPAEAAAQTGAALAEVAQLLAAALVTKARPACAVPRA